MREATPTLRGFIRRRADLAYAIVLGLGLAAISLGLKAVFDLVG